MELPKPQNEREVSSIQIDRETEAVAQPEPKQ
jgi:hypothetical protein